MNLLLLILIMNLEIYHSNTDTMEELVNIVNYCNTVLVRYGKIVKHCTATYIPEEDVINVNIRYRLNGNESLKTFIYQIQNFDFLMTDVDIQVNRSAINNINAELEKFISKEVYS